MVVSETEECCQCEVQRMHFVSKSVSMRTPPRFQANACIIACGQAQEMQEMQEMQTW